MIKNIIKKSKKEKASKAEIVNRVALIVASRNNLDRAIVQAKIAAFLGL